jgi:hypothetical protein
MITPVSDSTWQKRGLSIIECPLSVVSCPLHGAWSTQRDERDERSGETRIIGRQRFELGSRHRSSRAHSEGEWR